MNAITAMPSVDPSLLARLDEPAAGAGSPKDRKALEKAAKDFESILLHRMLEEMRQSVPDSGLLDGPGNEQIQSMFWYGLAQELSAKGGIGLWQQLSRQIQGLDNPPAKPVVSEKV
jgi:Rod binding domain-containing protein